MSDRLPQVLCYVSQGFRPIPCHAGTKHAAKAWTRYQREDPTRVDLHRWWTGTRQNDENVALILGPQPGGNLLAVNVNHKNGVDGFATLQRLGWEMPPTPTIHTPSGGRCYFFKVPDPAIYPSPFDTHVHPDGYHGLEFRGGRGYQLVPTSRTPEGRYEFLPPWRLDRLRADLADLPGAILQAWVRLDRSAEKSERRRTRDHGQDSQTRTASASAQITHPSSPPTPHTRSQARTARKAPATPPPYTTITTRLCSNEHRLFVDGFDVYERECAEALCHRMDLDVESLDDGRAFLCRLPGHREREPSAMWGKTATGYYLYKDWHQRSGEPVYTVPEVFAALATRRVLSLPKPSRMAWRLRLMMEEGWLVPERVPVRPLPDAASDLLRRYVEGFRLLLACRSCHPKTVTAAAPFTKAFAARWCGIPEGSVWSAHQEAVQRDLLVFAGLHKGQALYRLGKAE